MDWHTSKQSGARDEAYTMDSTRAHKHQATEGWGGRRHGSKDNALSARRRRAEEKTGRKDEAAMDAARAKIARLVEL